MSRGFLFFPPALIRCNRRYNHSVDHQTAWEKRIQQRFPEFEGTATEAEFFNQWAFTGKFVDYGSNSAECGLCGNHRLRYHFLVVHRETGEALWVGSQCVLSFGVSGRLVNQKQRTARQTQEPAASQKSVLQLIDQLQNIYHQVTRSDQRKIRWLVGKFQQSGAFSPKDAAWLFQVMLVCGVRPDFKIFPITLRTKKDRTELKALSLTLRRLLAPSLDEKQRAECVKMGIDLGE